MFFQQITEYPPKLIHQPQNIIDRANQPQTIECPIEANPRAEIKWFKDNLPLISQMPHSEQQGNELIINELNVDDTGIYHCEATNYLGTTISEQFKLTVQSSKCSSQLQLVKYHYLFVLFIFAVTTKAI